MSGISGSGDAHGDESVVRLMLLGRTGSGKSASGNGILQTKLFKSPKRHTIPVTKQFQVETTNIQGTILDVVDTPDMLLNDLSSDEIEQFRSQCLNHILSGLHALLLVVPVGEDLLNEHEILDYVQNLVSPDVKVQKFTFVLFTREDHLEDDETIEQYIQSKSEIQELVERCGGKFQVLNNVTSNQEQVTCLLHKIRALVEENNGKPFTGPNRRRSLSLPPHFSGEDGAEGLPELPTLRMILLGKTGAGKSASGNTILGRNIFPSDTDSVSQTKQCATQKVTRGGKNIIVVDTPGLFDTRFSDNEINKEILKCITYSAPGPHAFLIVIKVGRFTKEERLAVDGVRQLFGKNATNFIMILFTNKDALGNKTVEEYLKNADPELKKLVEECGNRYHCLDNKKPTDYSQFTSLLHKIEMVVSSNKGTYFTNEMLEQVEMFIKELQNENLEKRVELFKKEHKNIEETEWQQIFRKLVEESRHDAQETLISEMLIIVWAKLTGKVTVTDEEKESAFSMAEREGLSRIQAARLVTKAIYKLARKKMCLTQ